MSRLPLLIPLDSRFVLASLLAELAFACAVLALACAVLALVCAVCPRSVLEGSTEFQLPSS